MYGEMKGSAMEERIKGQSQAELSGAGMYTALADAAREHGLEEAAELFSGIAGEHAAQSAFYAMLTGRYPFEETEYWQFIKGLSKAEESGYAIISGLADQVEGAGFPDAAGVIRTFASQHRHHAEVTGLMLDKYAPESVKKDAVTVYKCGVCGFEYDGDIDSEPEGFTCPLCGMPKDVFRIKDE